jgi:hypothetical protein
MMKIRIKTKYTIITVIVKHPYFIIVHVEHFSSSMSITPLHVPCPLLSHPVLEGKPNVNHVRARISNSRTQQLHTGHHHTVLKQSHKRGIIVDYIIMSETST